MHRNRFYLLFGDLVEWEPDSDAPVPWPDCRYFGQVFLAINEACPSLGLRFVLTDQVAGRLPICGDDVVVVCMRDEWCRIPTFAHDVRLVAKTYGTRRTPNVLTGRSLSGQAATLVQELMLQSRRVPTFVAAQVQALRHRRKATVIDLPLGTYLLEDVPFIPFEERRYDVAYAGSNVNSSREARRRIPTQKMRSRQELRDAVEALIAARPEVRLGLHVTHEFHDAERNIAPYSRLLMDSRIVLCPRGGSLETYRFFEALRCGSVPVTERLPPREFYTGFPGATVGHWSALGDVVDDLLSNPDRLRRIHDATLAWWSERCSPAAVASRLLAALAPASYFIDGFGGGAGPAALTLGSPRAKASSDTLPGGGAGEVSRQTSAQGSDARHALSSGVTAPPSAVNGQGESAADPGSARRVPVAKTYVIRSGERSL